MIISSRAGQFEYVMSEKKTILIFISTILLSHLSYSQVKSGDNNLRKDTASSAHLMSVGLRQEPAGKRFLLGFSFCWPTGTWPETALTEGGSSSHLNGQGNEVKRFGLGILMQQRFSNHFSLVLDINSYRYNIFLAKKGEDVQSAWTISESEKHLDEPGAPQTAYVQDLPSDVNFEMASTGLRLGGKYTIGNRMIKPWAGAAFGFYMWSVHYYNENKSFSYGSDNGYVIGTSFQLGVDVELPYGIMITPFADFASPEIKYNIEGLFYPAWNYEGKGPVMGTIRLGIMCCFRPFTNKK
jgi:hypothetical protein